jgi:putative ABC transport system substrate-binding protein
MRRRDIVALVGTAAGVSGLPLALRAQHRDRLPRLGMLITPSEAEAESQARLVAFRRGLAELGWNDGENLSIEYRFGGGDYDRIRAHAAELVALAPTVIIANGTPAASALKEATRSVPVVFALVIDPVGARYVSSMARPGGNATGFTFIDLSLTGKWAEMLASVAPGISRAALVHNPATTPYYGPYLLSPDARARRPSVVDTPVQSAGDIEAAIAAVAQEPGGSLIFPPDPFVVIHLERLTQLAARFRLPAISVYLRFAKDGGLMAYGPDTLDIFRRAAAYADRILRGASPGDLPVQAPDKYDFAVNLKTASALGLKVPPSLLSVADEVIE